MAKMVSSGAPIQTSATIAFQIKMDPLFDRFRRLLPALMILLILLCDSHHHIRSFYMVAFMSRGGDVGQFECPAHLQEKSVAKNGYRH
jgi:hypothetical protein